MENKITKSAKVISQKQRIVVIVTGVSLVLILFLFLSSGGKKKETDLSKIITNSKNKIILQDSSKGIKAEDRWLYEAQGKLNDVDDFMKRSEEDKTGLSSRLDALEQQYQEEIGSQSELLESQATEIDKLKSKLQNFENERGLAFNPNDPNSKAGANGIGFTPDQLPRTIGSLDLNLEEISSKSNKKGLFNINDYVPAGSYAKATIISGVDASVGISSQSDPRPVLIRVKSPAFSSIYDKELQKTDLTGCLITGAASGDLSSEKIYVKLVNMTCGKGGDLVAEIPVKGYLAGQGKSGIRGNVISREGDLLVKSFLAGLVSGFGQGLSEKVAPPLNFSNGLTTQGTLSNKDVVNKGFGKGASTAGDRLANYLIDRAEQYQPVVSIPSGIDVEVVFVEGFYFNAKEDKKVKNQHASFATN